MILTIGIIEKKDTLLSALSEPNSDTIPIQQVDKMAEGRQNGENSNPPPSSK
ncbi:hypothetical protein HanRHA438_Chr11g0487411 [Helianthus annuus]|nr:hypothetical protein HanIR_Chr11g0510691 [Helianthus annuus]KAJ0869279.1 hypothetical protein HanRHA438_Chr11g0487411 [Helianthus annuus]